MRLAVLLMLHPTQILRLVVTASKNAKDDAKAAEWAFHNFELSVKNQVAAQFGVDSNEYQSLGLKKKSERKAPTSKKAKAKNV